MNTQDRNAGNAGDVAKHVAWVGLAQALLGRCSSGRLLALDSHAYRYRSALSEKAQRDGLGSGRSAAELLGLAPQGEAVQAYQRLQDAARTEFGPRAYLCSTGLACRLLPPGRTRFCFAEAHPETRRALGSEVRRLHPGLDLALAREASELEEAVRPALGVAALFDPFTFRPTVERDTRLWASLGRTLAAASRPTTAGFLLAFNFDLRGPAWPLLGARHWSPAPCAARSDGPFHLALYATHPFRARAAAAAVEVGFRGVG